MQMLRGNGVAPDSFSGSPKDQQNDGTIGGFVDDFRFSDPKLEQAFQMSRTKGAQGHIMAALGVCHIVCVFYLVRILAVGYSFSLSVPYMLLVLISALALCGAKVCMRLHSRYLVLLISLYSMSMMILILWALENSWGYHEDEIMTRLVPHLGDDTIAYRAVRTEVYTLQAKHLFTEVNLAAVILTIVLGLIGYSRSIFCVSMVIVVVNMTYIFLHFAVPLGVLLVRGMVSIIAVVGPMCSLMFHTLERRKRFRAEANYETHLRCGREADSILNHTLKNTMADAAGQIELFLQACDDQRRELHQNDREQLELSIASLRRGMRSCRYRQVYLQLVAGTYIGVPHRFDVQEFLSELCMGRRMATHITLTAVQAFFFDPVLLGLILDNAVSNAFKHGRVPDRDVRLYIREVNETNETKRGIEFEVINPATPGQVALTPEYVDRLFSGETRQQAHTTAFPISYGLGLQHIKLAAHALGITIELYQEDSDIHFKALIPVPTAENSSPAAGLSQTIPMDTSAFPTNVHVCYLDDSVVALKILQAALQKHGSVANVGIYGEKGISDVDLFMNTVLNRQTHIAILDQHLDFSEGLVYGVDIIARLKARDFAGLICIRSSNADDTDCKHYMDAGAHVVLGKDLPMSEAIDTIKVAYMSNPCFVRLECVETLSPTSFDQVTLA